MDTFARRGIMADVSHASERSADPSNLPDSPVVEPVPADPVQRPERLYAKPDRSAMTPRHMVAVMLLIGAVSSRCSFSPEGPTGRGAAAPTVDLGRELRAHAPRLAFPVREPVLPPGWSAGSVGTETLGRSGQDRAIRVGLTTASGRYLRFSQSTGVVADLVELETHGERVVEGSQVVDGTNWLVFPAERSESAWVADRGKVRLLITGNGTEAEFRILATALLTAPVLPER
jgi:hypothetical protein